jgi:protein CMS1
MEDGSCYGSNWNNLAYHPVGALKIDRIERIVIDASHIDQKKRGILEMKETQVPLTVWLGHKLLRERYQGGDTELLFY